MKTLLHIYVPLSAPSIATLSLFCIVGHWNDYFNGMILINDPKKIPLQTYIQSLVADISTKINSMTAEEIKAASERDHWMTADEAKDFGLVDKIITAKR